MGSYLAIGEFPLRIVPTEDGGEGIRLIFALCVTVGNARARVRKGKKTVRVEIKAFEPLVQA